MVIARTGAEARAATGRGTWGTSDGPYAQGYEYDAWGNLTRRFGWGGEVQQGSPTSPTSIPYGYAGNRRVGLTYDASGNLTDDGGQHYTYDAAGRQVSSDWTNLQQVYDGEGLRVRKSDASTPGVYYLRSSVLGGQVVCEVNGGGGWQRGYVLAGAALLAVQQGGGVFFMHEDPVTKSKRVTNISGGVVSAVELDPLGAEAGGSANSAFQPKRFTTYERDANGTDEAMMRRYNRWHARFDQPDPYEGSYDLADPQSLNRYSYVRNDPVNFTDPTGLDRIVIDTGAAVTVIGYLDSAARGGVVAGLGALLGGSSSRTDLPLDPNEVGLGLDGAGGGGPQNPAPQQPTGDCARFADRVAEIASRHNDVGDFVNDLARTFIGVASSDVVVMQQRANTNTGEYFSSTGFRDGLFDDVSDNQARHFMGGLIAGYNAGIVTVARTVMNWGENSQADRRVNEISIPLGVRLTNSRREEIVDRGDRGGWRRIPAIPGFKALADMIRNQICAR